MATIEQPAEMKQTQRPGAPSEVRALQFEDKRPDVSKLTEFAGKAYKDSITNWNYYLKNEWKKQSEEAVAQFGNNPAQLMGALEKIRTSMLPEDTPKQIRDSFLEDTYYDSASIMNKAQTNYNTRQRKETKANAGIYADGLTDDIATSYFNVLTYNTAPAEEKRPMDLEIYVKQRADLAKLADLTDDDGNFYFSETQRKNMKNPSEAILNGFRDFIYRPDLKQLEQWDQDIFQNRDEFMKSTGIGPDIYDSMEKLLKQRLKDLKNEDGRKIKSQAMFEAATLIKDGNDKAKVDELRKNPNIPKKLVDKAVKLNEDIINSHWYDPNRESDPTSALEVMGIMGEIANDTDTTPDGLERKVEKALNALDTTIQNAPKANLSDNELVWLRDWLSDTLTDNGFAQNIQMLDASPWVNSVVEARKAEIETNYAMHEPKALEKFEAELEAYHSKGKLSPLEQKAEKSVLDTVKHGWIQRERSHRLAYNNAKIGLYDTIEYLKTTGDVNGAKDMLARVKYNYIKTYNSDWIPGTDFDRLQKEFDEGKKPVYLHNGILWEYQGYQNNGAIFKVKL
jgi:hypothetical protein